MSSYGGPAQPGGDLRSEFLFAMRVTFGEAMIRIGAGDGGRGARSLAPAAGGTFEGPHLRGDLLPPLPDYIVQRPDGVIEHDIRAMLRTDDGAHIYIDYPGIGHRGSLGPLDRAREDPTALYFRTLARFETGTSATSGSIACSPSASSSPSSTARRGLRGGPASCGLALPRHPLAATQDSLRSHAAVRRVGRRQPFFLLSLSLSSGPRINTRRAALRSRARHTAPEAAEMAVEDRDELPI